MKVISSEEVRLFYGDYNINDTIKALLFGELMKRTEGQIAYKSDWYHDALFINNIKGIGNIWRYKFFWIVRESGTDIFKADAEGEALLGRRLEMFDAIKVYRVILLSKQEDWSVCFELLEKDG